MWFLLSVAALLCWSGSDLFSKIGCRDRQDPYSPLKMILAVGIVMGLHAAYSLLFQSVRISWDVILLYLPVSLLYIGSMAVGYLGLRYIELSISSPICNASGALVAVLCLIFYGAGSVQLWQLFAVALVCAGVIGLGFVEAKEDADLRIARQKDSRFSYEKSFLALALPILYCLLDALGTFADSRVLELLDEDSANAAYELTFFAAGLVCFLYLVPIKKQKLLPRQEAPKYAGAVFETAGQLAYIYAIADQQHVILAAPIISSYCAVSVLWSRVFLKERLGKLHYLMIASVIAGVILLGVFES